MKYLLVLLRLFSGLLLACVPLLNQPLTARAVSSNVIIYQVQVGGNGTGTATQELILLYNQSTEDIDITNWCVKYASASDGSGFSSCISTPDAQTKLFVAGKGLISFATQEFQAINPSFIGDVVFSAGISGTGGHIRLVDATGQEVDKLGYGTAVSPEGTAASVHSAGSVLSRNLQNVLPDTDNNAVDFSSMPIHTPIVSGLYEVFVPIDACPNIEGLQLDVPEGFLTDEAGNCFMDVCPNLDDLQKAVPVGYELKEDGECQLIPLESRTIYITELYPDAPSYDTGQEFIELYNPNSETINLSGYALQVGPSFTKQYVFSDTEIGRGKYLTFSDLETGIILPNSSGVALRLVAPAGNTVHQTVVYENATETVSWALVDDVWIFTNQITPGLANKPYLQTAEDEVAGVTSVLGPCPAGKYRNPLTNRCRLLETAVSSLKPCDEDEYRNPETNRCRKIASSSTELPPCEPGKERNPETNRCRTVNVLSAQDAADIGAVEDIAPTSVSGALNWPVLGGTLLGTGGYMAYEWRTELRRRFLKH